MMNWTRLFDRARGNCRKNRKTENGCGCSYSGLGTCIVLPTLRIFRSYGPVYIPPRRRSRQLITVLAKFAILEWLVVGESINHRTSPRQKFWTLFLTFEWIGPNALLHRFQPDLSDEIDSFIAGYLRVAIIHIHPIK